jgi:hypothetical protein
VRSPVVLLLVLLSTNAFAAAVGPERRLAPSTSALYVATRAGYVAFWTETPYDVKAALISPGGDMIAQRTLLHDHTVTAAVADVDSIAIVTEHQQPGTVEVFRVASDLSSTGEPSVLGNGNSPAVAVDRGELLVGWKSAQGLQLARLDASLKVIRQRTFSAASRIDNYALATGPAGFIVAWDEIGFCAVPFDLCTGPERVRAATVSFDLTATSAIEIGPPGSGLGNAWWNGSAFDVLWHDDSRVYLSRIAGDGTLLDAAPRVVFGAPSLRYFDAFGIGVVGAHFRDATGTVGFTIARVDGDGTQEVTLTPFGPYAPISVVTGPDGRVLFGYFGIPGFASFYRIIDFYAEGGRPRPSRR